MSESAQTAAVESDSGVLRGVEYRDTHRVTSAAVKSIRAEWREKLELANRLSPASKLSARAGVLRMNLDMLDERIAEAGGEDALVFMLCAQVASGVTLTEWCKHYDINRGLVWAFLSEDESRLQRYYRAQEGVADEYVGDVVGISDTTDPERVQVDKLRIDTRMKVAAKYAGQRFGENRKVEVSGSVGLIAMLAGLDGPEDGEAAERAAIDVTPESAEPAEMVAVDAGGCAPPVMVNKTVVANGSANGSANG